MAPAASDLDGERPPTGPAVEPDTPTAHAAVPHTPLAQAVEPDTPPVDPAITPCPSKVGATPRAPRLGRVAGAAGPPLLAALPLLVLLGALVRDRPSITSYGDRAVTALAVGDLRSGHQLLGAYSRFGWHHPGPAFFLPLAAAATVIGGTGWALDAGMLVTAAVVAFAFVAVVLRSSGRLAAAITAGVVGAYVYSAGPVTFREPWNPWATLLPLAMLGALCAAAGAGSVPALAGGALVASALVQTHVGLAPVALAVLGAGAVLAWRAPPRSETSRGWRRTIVGTCIACTIGLWVPALVQEATGTDPNLTELWRFFTARAPGHSLSTAVATVGDRLAQMPLGDHARLIATGRPRGWHESTRPVALLAGYGVLALVVAVIGHRRGDLFARAAGVVTLAAMTAAVFAVRAVQGPLDGFVVAWVTAIPLACWAGVASLVSRPTGRGGRFPTEAGRRLAAFGTPTTAWVAAGMGVVACLVAATAAGAEPSARGEDAPEVSRVWQAVSPRLPLPGAGAVLVRVTDPYAWPVQAGLVLELTRHGWQARVERPWAFMFPGRAEPGGAEDAGGATGGESAVVTLIAVTPLGPAEHLGVEVATPAPRQSPDVLVNTSASLANARAAPGPP